MIGVIDADQSASASSNVNCDLPINFLKSRSKLTRRSPRWIVAATSHASGGISLEPFLYAKLPQARPLRAERCEVDTLSGKQRIAKGQGVLDRCWVPENLGTAYQPQETGKHHWHKN